MSLKERIEKDFVSEMKARNAFAVSVLRMLRASLKNAEIEAGEPLTDEAITQVVATEVKKLKDAKLQFEQAGREDLSTKSAQELVIMEGYLPEQMSDDDLSALVQSVKSELGITDQKEFGKLMGAVMKQVNGKADGNRVQTAVKSALSA